MKRMIGVWIGWLCIGLGIGVQGTLLATRAMADSGSVVSDAGNSLNTLLNALQLIALVGGAGLLMMRVGRMHGQATERLDTVNDNLHGIKVEMSSMSTKLNHYGERLARVEERTGNRR